MEQEFPLNPPLFTGRSRVVEPGTCFDWLRYGWAMTLADKGHWLLVTLIYGLAGILSGYLPWVGLLLICPLLPGLMAAIFLMCRDLDAGRAVRLKNIVTELRPRIKSLLGMGLLLALVIFVLATVLRKYWAGLSGPGLDTLLLGLVTGMAIILILLLPCLMALYFAPGLLAVHGMSVFKALKASIYACLKNILPFLIFSLLLSMLLCFALLSLGLGFFVLVPVWSGAVYASYRDIFVGI